MLVRTIIDTVSGLYEHGVVITNEGTYGSGKVQSHIIILLQIHYIMIFLKW